MDPWRARFHRPSVHSQPTPTARWSRLSGDGGLAMMLGDLLTLRQLKLPIKMVVFNNGALAFVELEMKAAGIVTYATDLDNPSFAEVANAIGIHGVRVEQPGDLESALRTAFATPARRWLK